MPQVAQSPRIQEKRHLLGAPDRNGQGQSRGPARTPQIHPSNARKQTRLEKTTACEKRIETHDTARKRDHPWRDVQTWRPHHAVSNPSRRAHPCKKTTACEKRIETHDTARKRDHPWR